MEMVVVGNVTFTDRPAGSDRTAFVGSLDQILEDVHTAAEAGADELIVDGEPAGLLHRHLPDARDRRRNPRPGRRLTTAVATGSAA
ncbi:hypothetical protein AB0F91_37975 [Amycolatopsis sp. NPDC023774]|uniref:hypothetical protein n=1 Tax=Amycolatopsis sp. NPDC023774 TaxID=3155015 RepID=UPI0033DA2F83